MYLTRFRELIPLDRGRVALFNTLTARHLLLGSEDAAVLPETDGATSDAALQRLDLVDRLRAGWFVFDSEGQERELFERVVRRFRRRPSGAPPGMVAVHVSEQCNHRCSYCYYRGHHDFDAGPTLSAERVGPCMDAVSSLFDGSAPSERRFVLYGGEPLLIENHDIIQMLLAQARAKGLKVTVITSGATLVEYADLLKRYAAQLDCFLLTMDGVGAVHERRRPFVADPHAGFERLVQHRFSRAPNRHLVITRAGSLEAELEGCAVETGDHHRQLPPGR